mmetsp:Transcript_87151/g.144941  ORF Transcript_87151/g.144941 Transcript_87151/m.144941 type:complete len:214 (+) Transcript_87151:164-805(+)
MRCPRTGAFAPCDWNFVFDGGTCPDCPGIVITARVTAEVGVQLRGSAQPHVLGSTGSLGLSNGGRLGQARSAGVCIADCPVSGAANDGPLSARLYPLRRMRHSHSWAAVGRLPQGRGVDCAGSVDRVMARGPAGPVVALLIGSVICEGVAYARARTKCKGTESIACVQRINGRERRVLFTVHATRDHVIVRTSTTMAHGRCNVCRLSTVRAAQ